MLARAREYLLDHFLLNCTDGEPSWKANAFGVCSAAIDLRLTL